MWDPILWNVNPKAVCMLDINALICLKPAQNESQNSRVDTLYILRRRMVCNTLVSEMVSVPTGVSKRTTVSSRIMYIQMRQESVSWTKRQVAFSN